MKVKKVLCSEALTGFYMDDKEAIKSSAKSDGFVYKGAPVTPGFRSIRQPGVAVSVMFILEDGHMVYGDCAVAQYAASGGRKVPNTAAALIKVIEKYVSPYFEGMDIKEFKSTAEKFDRYEFDGERLPASIRYGVTQAILEAVAYEQKLTMCEVILNEYNLPVDLTPVRINAQSGDERYTNVDKMILKKVGMMPHGLINNVEEKLGTDGQIFLETDLFNQGVRPAINVGISVSRVGGNAQIKAMKKVAGTLKMDQAQYRELEAFSKFSSDMDPITAMTIDKGRKNAQLLIQPQYSPMPVEQQIAILYCGTHGLLHDVPLENVQDFERSFIESLQLNHQEDVLDVLRTGVIDDNVTKAIEETAAMVAKQYL